MAKTTPRSQLADPLIDEVRQIREEIGRECGHDLKKLFEELHKIQEQHQDMVIRRKCKSADPT
ncbi:MAG: hypothetical protein IID34_18165 [Planctomycetes bacterium]|nr:hypothetical protein [Planctomycetota bacterium]